MKRWLLIFLLPVIHFTVYSQTISGKVTDFDDNALTGANVFLNGTYDGSISDTLGNFRFSTNAIGEKILTVKFIGYEDIAIPVVIEKSKSLVINVKLKEKKTEITEVTITAGVFEAGDKKRGLQLKSIDILTTANSNGDIAGGLNTLPGLQTVGEEGGLFVRGGEKNETKTFVDGMLVSNPYTSKMPDLPSRGRFSPMLFSGVSFSTGGYSAEYGQALSSALILNTPTVPAKGLSSISLIPFGSGITKSWKGDSSSFTSIIDYHNMTPYYKVIKQEVDWKKCPQGISTTLLYRKKIGKTGFLKSFASITTNRLGMLLPEYLAENNNRNLTLVNNDLYINSVYTVSLPDKWEFKAGGALNYDVELVSFDHFSANTYNSAAQARFTLQKYLHENVLIKTGAEIDYQHYHQDYLQKDTGFNATMLFNSVITACFVEGEWSISQKMFIRIGSRMEIASLIQETKVVPRLSLAYKTSKNSQVSLAYGIFTELPKNDYMKFKPALLTENASHYIINYQISRNDRMFRTEAFYKEYNHLVTYDNILNDPDPMHYHSKGYGYARGLEFFLRDKKTLQNGDFWISYTFLDTKKKYQDIKSLQMPYLFSKNSLSVVGKIFVPKLNTQFGLTYQYSSGRPYYEPLINGLNIQHFTADNNNISLNLSYLTHILNNFTVIHFSVNNVFGSDPIFGYHYSAKPDTSGHFTAFPIKSQAKRFFVLGVFITFDKYSSSFN